MKAIKAESRPWQRGGGKPHLSILEASSEPPPLQVPRRGEQAPSCAGPAPAPPSAPRGAEPGRGALSGLPIALPFPPPEAWRPAPPNSRFL